MVVYEVGTTCSCPREFALLFHIVSSAPRLAGNQALSAIHPRHPPLVNNRPVNTRRWTSVGLMLGQHQPNVGSTSRICCAWTHIPRGNVHFHLWLVIGPVIIADRFLSFIFPVCVDPLNYYQYTDRWPTLLLPTPYITCGSSRACVMNFVCTHFKSIKKTLFDNFERQHALFWNT